jgi:hypothetical protein
MTTIKDYLTSVEFKTDYERAAEPTTAALGSPSSGEAGRKTHIALADARALLLAPIVTDIRASGITSWYGIAIELNKGGVPTATGRGIWEPGRIRRVMERVRHAG